MTQKEKRDPTDLHLRLKKAISHHQAGRRNLARRGYEGILARHPDQADAIHFLGVMAFEDKNFSKAVKLISTAARTQSQNEHLLNNLGNALRDCGRHAEAISSYRRS